MAAYMTGVKMRNEVISMSADTVAVDGAGKQYVSGEDSTCPRPQHARPDAAGTGQGQGPRGRRRVDHVGHATPATTYAHVCNRNGYNTIAEQSTPGHANYNTRLGDGIDVLLGGGQRNYLPKPLNPASKRTDGVNLVTAFQLAGYTRPACKRPVLAKRDGL